MTIRRRRLVIGVVGLVAALLSVSCVAMWESMYPLGEDAKRVAIVGSGQDLSVELAGSCRKTGRMQPVMSEHFAKLEAAKVRANVAQVLTATYVNGRVNRLDVRFWSCPDVAKLDLGG